MLSRLTFWYSSIISSILTGYITDTNNPHRATATLSRLEIEIMWKLRVSYGTCAWVEATHYDILERQEIILICATV
jgi:hypothetical protein